MMRDQYCKNGLFRVLVLAWAGCWVLLAPFLHIHPSVDHHHGAEGHAYGLVHTIWSPDRECEFDTQGVTDQEQGQDQDDAGRVVECLPSLFHAEDQHAEFVLTMFSDSSARRLVSSLCAYSVAVTQPDLSEPDCKSHFRTLTEERPRPIFLPNDRSSRAPPF